MSTWESHENWDYEHVEEEKEEGEHVPDEAEGRVGVDDPDARLTHSLVLQHNRLTPQL